MGYLEFNEDLGYYHFHGNLYSGGSSDQIASEFTMLR